MTFEPVDLNLTDPTKGYLHFVLYTEAHPAILAWTESSAADRGRNELTLRDLKAMQQS
ncbi:hypothetical protein ACWGLG_34245 [Streptomyces antimycoticus]